MPISVRHNRLFLSTRSAFWPPVDVSPALMDPERIRRMAAHRRILEQQAKEILEGLAENRN